MLSVIRIALKWLIGLLCGYVITTAGVTPAHHIRHQSEGCVVMMGCSWRRYYTVRMTTAHGILLVSYPSGCFVQTHVSKVLPQLIFQLCISLEDRSHFNMRTAKCGKCFILVGFRCEFLWGCHFLNYGKETLVWWVYCVGRRRIYRWLALIKVWE